MNMDEFKAALEADTDMAEAFKAELEKMTPEKAESEAEAFSLAAANAGLDISVEEVERAVAAAMELDDAELEEVSGGDCYEGEDPEGHDNFCIGVWHCCNVFMHTSAHNEMTDCFSDYRCEISYYHEGTAECGQAHRSQDNCWWAFFKR